MSIAVLRRKAKFKSRTTSTRTDYGYVGQPKDTFAYKGFSLNMTGRGTVRSSKFSNSGKLAPNCFCNKATGAASNLRQSHCGCNKQVPSKQMSYSNRVRRAMLSVPKSDGSSGLRGRMIRGNTVQEVKRAPDFSSSQFIQNKKSSTLQCVDGCGGNLPPGCSYPNKSVDVSRDSCKISAGKTTYTRMVIPCTTMQNTSIKTASEHIASKRACRVCKSDGTVTTTGAPCGGKYESSLMPNRNIGQGC